jgi:signal transduction histidine kinase
MNDPGQLERVFESIERNAHKQLEIMEALLDLYRVKSGKVEPQFRKCNLPAIIHDVFETIAPSANSKQLQVQQVFDCEPGQLTANPAWLTQVFTNLLTNAVKFTPSGGTIRVSCVRSEGCFRVEISDTGIGIPPHLLDDVFVPFKRANARIAGSGLGLAIVRELVGMHKGRVYAHSKGEGQGASFIVELPISAAQSTCAGLNETQVESKDNDTAA